MNVKHILILTILAFLLINAVNAADNVTDDIPTADIDDAVGEEVLAANDDAVDEEVLTSNGDINVTFEEQMYKEDLSDIDVVLPENSSGEFCIKIDNEVIYNQTITEKSFKVPVKLPKRGIELVISIWPPIDCKTYRVDAYYNSIDLNLNKTLKVMSYPKNHTYFNFPEEVLQKDKNPFMFTLPRSSNGILELYLDDKLFNRTKAHPIISLEKPTMVLGTHHMRILYYNDTYYNSYDKTFEFNVTRAVIEIPELINIGHDDCIAVKTPKGTQGTVKIYVDSKLVNSEKLDDYYYVFSLENYITPKSREVTVTLTTPDFTRTKTKSVKMFYDFDIFVFNSVYGEENTIEIDLPDNLNNKLLKITLNGAKINFKRQDTVNNMLEADISNLKAGNYSLLVSYPGDGKFYPLNKTYNFTINYRIHYPYSVTYGYNSKVSLKLPKDAKGTLELYMADKLWKSSKFKDGYAEIIINSLRPGYYWMDAVYAGDDYDVDNTSFMIYSNPKISFDHEITVGESNYITLEVPKDCRGYAVFHVGGKSYNVTIKDGIARYSIKNLKVGEHEIFVDYYGEDGYKDPSNWIFVTVHKPKIKVLSSEATFKSINVKIKLLDNKGSAMAKRTVTVKVNGKTFKVKTNKKGIAMIKKSLKLKKKKVSIKLSYRGAKVTKKLKVKPIHLKVTKTRKKVIIKASIKKAIKDRIVKIKVNSKSFKVKTNRKGVAKLTVKKPKKIKIKATYKKNTIKFNA